jgi:hypothetical protein
MRRWRRLCEKSLHLALAAGVAMGMLGGASALAQAPTCNGKNVYPCVVAGTLLVVSKPTGLLPNLNGAVSFGGGSGAFINDPQNPGFSLTGFSNLQGSGPTLPSAAATFSVATVGGQATITGASLSITCGVTGAATYSLTLSTPGNPLVVSCPHVAASGITQTVTAQTSFTAVSSLALTLTAAGTATTGSDTVTVGALSAQVQIPSATCVSTISPGGQAFGPAGGTGSIAVTTGAGCPWGVFNIPSWVTITSSASGTGNGVITYQVAPNPGADLSGTMMVTNVPFTLAEEGTVAGLSFIGSMAHIAAQENWTTAFTLVNKGVTSATARLSLFGDPSGALTIPLVYPQQPPAAAPLLASSVDGTLGANASLIIDSAGPQTPPVQMGSAQLLATGAVDGFAIFHLIPGAQEAVVPMETRNAGSYLLVFDNTGGVVLGVAVANVSAQAGVVGLVIRNDAGAVIATGSLPMAGDGHTSFVLSTAYPITANIRGTVEFDTPTGGQISVLGIRTTPLGTSTTLTTIPALANVGTSGGSIAHLATGNGWQTTFVLVNTGSAAAPVHLAFFSDAGGPLSLPLAFPQLGGATSTASTLNQSLAAGATLIVQSVGLPSDPAPTIGSVQLSSSGNIGGFVIFRYNPNGQEAVVPLESRNASAYLLAFDNTSGTATGIAINSVSMQNANIPVVVRDDTGNQIATDTLTLVPNGHLAFTLVTDKYAVTANKRGTIEFDTPAGGQIGALGIRIPAGHTFTTLPALAK